MSGDYSRQRFDPKRDLSGVLMQQGRVQLDSDWNELIGILDRRFRAGTTDIVGRHVVPRETANGFQIQVNGTTLTIGQGRIYVDGLLAENHGKTPLEFDPVLAEERGSKAIDFEEQPYLPNAATIAPPPEKGGPHLVYLNVWQREVNYLQDPDLIEKAVGIDTTTRLQTVWQVKVLRDVGAGAKCDTQFQKWDNLIAPSDGRLSTKAVTVPTSTDPCLLPPGGGYRGLENRLYRVEIHDGGPAGTAMFKWSHDNASVSARVTAITALDKLTVSSGGRDSVMWFKPGDWIEITDDWLDFARQSGVSPPPEGVVAQIDDIHEATRTIKLRKPIRADVFGTDAQGNTDPARHTRVRRWDQSGEVHDTNNNFLVDLNAVGAKGVIPVPPAGTSIILERGVQITFETPAGGNYHVGDYWNFAARTIDASVEELKQAPPRGIHHHFCRLALVTFPGSVTDCRVHWPPEISDEGCACTVCVSADDHNSGKLSLQTAINNVIKAGGGTICLGIGKYDLKRPLRIEKAMSLRIVGKGRASQLHSELTAIVEIIGGNDVNLESFSVLCHGNDKEPGSAVSLRSLSQVRVERLGIEFQKGSNENWSAIGLSGALMGVVIRDNTITAPAGIVNIAGEKDATGLTDLRIEDNRFECDKVAVRLTGVSVHQQVACIARNRVIGCAETGFELTGLTVPGFGMEVTGNELQVVRDGIVAGADGLRIIDNDLSPFERSAARGIVLTKGVTDDRLEGCQIIGNRITAFTAGIITDEKEKEMRLGSVAIAYNQIVNGKIGLMVHGEVGHLSIDNNQMNGIGESAITARSPGGRVIVCGNQIADARIGLLVNESVERLTIENNQMKGIRESAINVRCPKARVTVCGNLVEIFEGAPGVMIECPEGDCVFSNNQSLHSKPKAKEGVMLSARTLVVASNRIAGGVLMDLHPVSGAFVTAGAKTNGPLCTVIGNITEGGISVLNAKLAPPWDLLNLQGVV